MPRGLDKILGICFQHVRDEVIDLGLEFVREKWNPVLLIRQTKIREARVCLVQSEPDKL